MSMGNYSDTDPSKIPLIPNPDGSEPNFTNPSSLERAIWSVLTILLVLMYTIGFLRFRTNLKLHKKLAVDDYFCFCAIVLVTTYDIITMTVTSTARHMWDVPASAINASWIKHHAVIETTYGPAIWFAKTSILAMYLRLFNVVKWMRWCCWLGIVILFCAFWSLVPASAVYSFPWGHEHWDTAMTEDSRPLVVPFMIVGVISVASDLYILILPLPVLLRLRIHWKKKVALCLVFAVGIMFVSSCQSFLELAEFTSGIVSSCFTLYFRVIVWQNKLDTTWNVSASTLTSAVELNIAVIVSCAPAAAASWKHILHDSVIVSSLRYAIGISRQFLLRAMSGANPGKQPSTESVANLTLAESIQLNPRAKTPVSSFEVQPMHTQGGPGNVE